MPPARNSDSSMYIATAIAITVGIAVTSATVLMFFITAAKPRIAGTKLAPTPDVCARNSFHQSKLTPSAAACARHARAEVRADLFLQHDRQRHREQQRRQPHADHQPRRALDAIHAVDECASTRRSLGRKPVIRGTRTS